MLSLLAGCGAADTDVGVSPADAQPDSTGDAGDGGALWSWRYHWFQTDNCAMYGADARVHLRIGTLDGGTVNPPRLLDAPCVAGELLVQLPSQSVNRTTFTVESVVTGKKSLPQTVTQDIHMARDMFFTVRPAP